MDDRAVECDNCTWTGTVDDTEYVRDIHSRVEPGGEMPAGECPECGSLCYLVEARDNV